MKKLSIIFLLSIFAIISCEEATTEPDENDTTEINKISIGNQTWMAENLDVSLYRNGDTIRHCRTQEEWEDANNKQEGAWWYYDNDTTNSVLYGKLYNWYAVNDPRGLAPEGWHVASDEEWKELEMYLGMSQSQADTLGERGIDQGAKLAGRADLWKMGILVINPNFGTSGFNAVPYDREGILGQWWTSSEIDSADAWSRRLVYDYTTVTRWNLEHKKATFSVRCVKD